MLEEPSEYQLWQWLDTVYGKTKDGKLYQEKVRSTHATWKIVSALLLDHHASQHLPNTSTAVWNLDSTGNREPFSFLFVGCLCNKWLCFHCVGWVCGWNVKVPLYHWWSQFPSSFLSIDTTRDTTRANDLRYCPRSPWKITYTPTNKTQYPGNECAYNIYARLKP